MGPIGGNIDRCALGPPRRILGPPYRVGGNQAVGPIPVLAPPTGSPLLTWHDAARMVGDAGRDIRAIRRWLAGGQIGRVGAVE